MHSPTQSLDASAECPPAKSSKTQSEARDWALAFSEIPRTADDMNGNVLAGSTSARSAVSSEVSEWTVFASQHNGLLTCLG